MRRGVGWEVDGVEGFGAAEADGGVCGILAYVGDVSPAAVAFGGGCETSLNAKVAPGLYD
jgi:hypothetical protein